jgi:hypothetical protein
MSTSRRVSSLTETPEDELQSHHSENFYGTTHASGGGASGGYGSFQPFVRRAETENTSRSLDDRAMSRDRIENEKSFEARLRQFRFNRQMVGLSALALGGGLLLGYLVKRLRNRREASQQVPAPFPPTVLREESVRVYLLRTPS